MTNILIDFDVFAPALEQLRGMKGVKVETIHPVEKARFIEPQVLKDKQILFCTFPPTNVQEMSALQMLQIGSAGYTQLFDLGLAERHIRCCNATGVNDLPIAQWNVAMMVNLARDLRGMLRNQEAGLWDRAARFQSDLTGKTVGIWGYGGIGRETARLAKALGMTVHVLSSHVAPRPLRYLVKGTGDPEGKLPDRVFKPEQKTAFLNGLDFLVLSLPLTQKTKGLLGYDELTALPARAFLLNPARGPLVQEEALLRVLREGKIAGAALDTHYSYPMPADHPLWRFPNVIMTPHISGSTLSPFFLPRLWELFTQNVERFIQDQPLLNELTPAQLQGQ
jgi:phosphoglycerate dehydrogenase-like enzyme